MSLLYDPEQDAESNRSGMEVVHTIPAPGFYDTYYVLINSATTALIIIFLVLAIFLICRRYRYKVINLNAPIKRFGFTLSLLGVVFSVIGVLSSNEVSVFLFINSIFFRKWLAPESNILGAGIYMFSLGIYLIYIHDFTGKWLINWIVRGKRK